MTPSIAFGIHQQFEALLGLVRPYLDVVGKLFGRSVTPKERATANWAKVADKVSKLTKGTKLLQLADGTKLKPKLLEMSYVHELFHENHIYGGDLDAALKTWKQSASPLSFDQYLAHDPATTNSTKKVTYLSEEERDVYAATIEDGVVTYQGKFLDTNNPEFNYTAEPAIYVISSSGKMYISKPEVYKFHHSSFLSGQPTIGAGTIYTDSSGQIVKISNISGHYKPAKENLLNTLRFLKSKGSDLKNITVEEIGRVGSNLFEAADFGHIKVFNSAARYLEAEGSLSEDGYTDEGITVFYRYQNDSVKELKLKAPNYMSKHDILKFAQELAIRLKAGHSVETLVINFEHNSHFKYKLTEIIRDGAQAQFSEFEGGKLENKTLTLDKLFDDPKKALKWRTTILLKLISNNKIEGSTPVKIKTDQGVFEETTVHEYLSMAALRVGQ